MEKNNSSSKKSYKILDNIQKNINKEILQLMNIQNNYLKDFSTSSINSHNKLLGKLSNFDKNTNMINDTIKNIEKTYLGVTEEIERFFSFLKENNQGNKIVFLNERQSLLWKELVEQGIKNTILRARLEDKVQYLESIINQIKTTKYEKIGKPNERDNRIAVKYGHSYYIDGEGTELISNLRIYWEKQDKHTLKIHDGTQGYTPFSLYTHDGTLIAKKIEKCIKISDNEYKIGVGDRDRDEKKGYIPSKIPATINHKGLDGSNLIFHIDKYIE